MEQHWHRVEAPGTYHGHSLVSEHGGRRYVATQLKDGRWQLEVEGRKTTHDDLTELRRAANPSTDGMVASGGWSVLGAVITMTAVVGVAIGIGYAVRRSAR